MPVSDSTTALALRIPVEGYASGLDRRDTPKLLSAFHANARFRVHHPSTATTPTSVRSGHAELAELTSAIQRYSQTFHFLGQSTFDVDGATATGETYCLAHHLSPGLHGGDNLVMHIRYEDHLRLGKDGVWRFEDRSVLIDWMDRRLANAVTAP